MRQKNPNQPVRKRKQTPKTNILEKISTDFSFFFVLYFIFV